MQPWSGLAVKQGTVLRLYAPCAGSQTPDRGTGSPGPAARRLGGSDPGGSPRLEGGTLAG
jgi:hypothetical protein